SVRRTPSPSSSPPTGSPTAGRAKCSTNAPPRRPGRAISASSWPPHSTHISAALSITNHEDVRLEAHPGVISVSFGQIPLMAYREDVVRSEPEWLTLGQAARFLRVAQHTIRKWSGQGRVPAFYTPGGHRRFRRGDLESF